MLFPFSLPESGALVRIPRPQGSADSLALAQTAQRLTVPLVIVTETAGDAQRLLEEIPWFAPQLSVHLLPDWETLPYDHFSPHPDLVSERLATLYLFTQNACDVVIMPATTALLRLPPEQYLAAHTFMLKKGQRLDLDALRGQCTRAGYAHVNQVLSPGEFSVRGGIIDLFPMGSTLPYRIDLFDDEIESIRTFDVDNQRSLYPVGEIRLLPAREFPLDEAGIARFRQKYRETFEGDPSRSRVYKDVSGGLAPGGVEWYLPLFFEQTATLFDYLPADSLLCLHGDLDRAAQEFWRETQSRHRLLAYDRERPILPPEAMLQSAEQFFSAAQAHARVQLSAEPAPDTAPLPAISIERSADNPLHRLRLFPPGFQRARADRRGKPGTARNHVAIAGRARVDTNTVRFLGAVPGKRASASCSLPRRCKTASCSTHQRWPLITETELYATQVRQQRRRDKERARSTEGMLRDLSELHENDPVVHEQHGVGRYLGLQNMDFGEGETEFLALQYAGGDMLYVPVSQLFLISRYSGGPPETAPLHRLGSGQWEKAKKKALGQIRDTAAELLALYAQRAARQGHAFKLNLHDYETFADNFPFEETPDQQAAIEAVINDMQTGRPMDRLVCGDVGFGKTEVALRAAFVAIMGGRQVAVLVPTTLLAEQHFLNFSDRFANWPIKIAELSRFRSAKEQAAALEGTGARHHRHRHRHAPADPAGRQVQESGPDHHRRGASLRRTAEGADEACAPRWTCSP